MATSFLVNEIVDTYVRENFRRLNAFLGLPGLTLANFQRLEITLNEAKTSFAYPHGLTYQPTDLIVSWLTGPGLVQFEYAKFDSTNIVLSTTGSPPTQANPTVVRVLVGAWGAS